MSEAEVVLILVLLGALAAAGLGLLWMLSRTLWLDDRSGAVDPILGAKDRVAIYRLGAPTIPHHPHVLIPLPERLKTKEEMVHWMTRELPRLTSEAAARPCVRVARL